MHIAFFGSCHGEAVQSTQTSNPQEEPQRLFPVFAEGVHTFGAANVVKIEKAAERRMPGGLEGIEIRPAIPKVQCHGAGEVFTDESENLGKVASERRSQCVEEAGSPPARSC